MKKSAIIHLVWLGIAIVAYSLGSRSGEQGADDAASKSETRGGANRLNPSGLGEPKQKDRQTAAGSQGTKPQSISTNDLLSALAKNPSEFERRLIYNQLVEAISNENGEEIFKQLASMEDANHPKDQIELLLFVWGKRGGSEAVELPLDFFDVEGHWENGETRAFLRSRLLAGWASTQPQAARAWLRSLKTSDPDLFETSRGTLEEGMFKGLMANDMDLASDFIVQLSEDGATDRANDFLKVLAHERAESEGFEAASQWSENLSDSQNKATAMTSIAFNYTKTDPQRTAAWAERYATEDWAADVVSRVAEEWAENDPEASIAWLETLPEGAGRSKASFTAFREWVRRDSIGASSYILEMERSPARDNAVIALAQTIERNDGEAAVKWAGEIGEPEIRQKAQTSAAVNWMKQDEAAARAWLESSDLPQSVKDKIAP